MESGALFDRRLDVARKVSRLATAVLRKRWIWTVVGPRDRGAIAQRPQAASGCHDSIDNSSRGTFISPTQSVYRW